MLIRLCPFKENTFQQQQNCSSHFTTLQRSSYSLHKHWKLTFCLVHHNLIFVKLFSLIKRNLAIYFFTQVVILFVVVFHHTVSVFRWIYHPQHQDAMGKCNIDPFFQGSFVKCDIGTFFTRVSWLNVALILFFVQGAWTKFIFLQSSLVKYGTNTLFSRVNG